jgi:hypothetical protein
VNNVTRYLLLPGTAVFVLACGGGGAGIEPDTHSPRYARAGCITTLSVQWRDWDDSAKALDGINRKLSKIVTGEVPNSEYPIAGIRYADRRGNYFIQFSDKCEERVQLTERLITHYFQQAHPIDSYSVSDQRIEPSPHTINVSGPDWVH